MSRAHDKDLGRDIAIKELLSRGRVNDLRFAREAMITARLEHPGIVPVYEAGRWPDGTPFYAMKLVSGRPLRDLIAERTTIDARVELLHHVIAVADAMAYAHGRRIIHRDLKPANVIVGEFGETVVIDWGLAKDLSVAGELPRGDGPVGPTEESLTSMGSVLGTPAYMAPEQERGEPVDQRADVFAIGAMLWELCSLHKVPPTETSLRHRMLRRAGIDPDLVTIIDKALDREPTLRYADAGALASDLKAFKAGSRIAGRSYSPWAMLAHWTRRHRALALSVITVVALAASGVVAFIRNTATERDRADAAMIEARQERDRARLSEASLIVDKDPNRAGRLLASFETRTPQVALLTSRASQLSAKHVVHTSSSISALFRAADEPTVEVRAQGDLIRLDPRTGAVAMLDRDLTGAFTYRDGRPFYARRLPGGRGVRITSPSNAAATGPADLESAVQLAALSSGTYVLDAAGILRELDGTTSKVVDRDIHRILGSGDLLLVCRTNGELDVVRGGVVVLRRRCAQTQSPDAMAIVGHDFAALGDDGTLLVSRGGRLLELPTGISGEYELVLSNQGVVALADYVAGGRTWFIRRDGLRLEPGPGYASQPYAVGADGNLVAWGYEDGTVIVWEATTGTTWQLHGHSDPVKFLVIDAINARVITASTREIRVWDIRPASSTLIKTMPCSIFHVEPSPDATQVALDCNDGSVSVWSRQTGAITRLHKHVGYSWGLQWMRGLVCSGGYGDGRVRCSRLDGTAVETLDAHTKLINSLTVAPDRRSLVFAASDGKVWRFGGALEQLYAHGGPVYMTAISSSGRLLASCAHDGSVAVFDLAKHRMRAYVFAHVGAFCSLSWMGDELWSAGGEGTIKRWSLHDEGVTLRHMVQTSSPMRLLTVMRGSWAAVVGAGVLLVSRDGASVAVRIDAGRSITALDVSTDRRYVAASVNGEIIVLDLERSALATVATRSPIQQLSFLEPTLIAFSEPTALKTLDVSRLDYVPFQLTPEQPSRGSF